MALHPDTDMDVGALHVCKLFVITQPVIKPICGLCICKERLE